MCGSEVVAINPKIFDINWVEAIPQNPDDVGARSVEHKVI